MGTYMNRVIGEDAVRGDVADGVRGVVTDGDGAPARLEVCVSIGEFDEGQTVIEVHAPGEYQMVCLDFTAAHALKIALDDALRIHADHMLPL